MTERKRRRYWRRGPRRKDGQEAAAGEDAMREETAPQEAAEPQRPAEAAAASETDEPREPPEDGGETEPKKSRRRPRRRPRRRAVEASGAEEPPGPGAAPAPEPGDGTPPVPEAPPLIVADAPEGESFVAPLQVPEGGDPGALEEAPAPPETERGAAEVPPAPAGPEDAAAPEAGHPARKSRRRRRRRRGEVRQPAPETVAADAAEAASREGAEAAFGAEGTISEEPAPAPAAVAAGTGDIEEEEAEEETGEEAAKGARLVMLIDGVHSEEIRVAIVSDGVLNYFEAENQRKKQFKGNIYKGRVVNVAPAIEAAFVDFGGGRHGFLPLSEYWGGAIVENLGRWGEGEKRPHLRSGMEILVQVTKEESAMKGAALTSYISIAGRYLVMMLGMKRYGISKKITSEKERERIRKNMEKLEYPGHLGFIVRTAGATRSQKELRSDLQNLLKLWDRVVEEARTQKAPALLYEEQDIVIRALRDHYSADITQVLIDSPDSYRKASDFFDIYYMKQRQKLVLYRQKRPLFSKFNLEEQLERMCARKVLLPSGGHIVIDRTEAMWCIDVNSGRSARDKDIEDTAFRTNKEAAVEVARQLRLRDMGGLIVVDFIDMESRGHIKDVERTLKEHMRKDRAKNDISSLGKFGLLSISRQRMGISFYEVLLRECEHCGGTGIVPTGDAIIVKLMRRIHDELSRDQGKMVVARVSPLLLEKIVNQKREEISRLERLCGSRVTIQGDPSLPAAYFAVEPAAT
jgi:ribonuclease E